MTPIEDTARPRLCRGVRLQEDKARGCSVLLAPERVLRPSATAAATLQLCDGQRSLAEIIDALAAIYTADRERLAADVHSLLADLSAKGIVEL